MIELNKNYDAILKQIQYIEEHFYKCISPNTSLYYCAIYEALCMHYYLLTGKNVYSNKIKHNTFLLNEGDRSLKKLSKQNVKNIIENKEYHKEVAGQDYQSISDTLDWFIQSPHFRKNEYLAYANLDIHQGEDEDILEHFLKTEALPLLPIYKNVTNNHTLFYDPCVDAFYHGAFIFNGIEEVYNIFLHEKCSNISNLSYYVHELGHGFDYKDYCSRMPFKQLVHFDTEGVYGEVLSTYYEQKFLEFCLQNDYKKEQALLSFIDYYDLNLIHLNNLGFILSLPDDYLFYDGVDVNKLSDDLLLTDSSELVSQHIDIPSAFFYSYGFLLSNYMLEHPEVIPQFLQTRTQPFNQEKLDSMGITPSGMRDATVKRAEKVFSKHL